jgi:hypothetical protein
MYTAINAHGTTPTSDPNQKALQSAEPGRCCRSMSRPKRIIALLTAKSATTAARSRMPTNSPISTSMREALTEYSIQRA